MKYVITQPFSIHSIGQRQNQEDSIYPARGEASENDRLFMVCDGMGGHAKGEVASNIVISQVSTYIKSIGKKDKPFTDKMLFNALNNAYNVLDENDDQDSKKMGTTMVLLNFHPGGVMAAHIGDSRYYHIRPKEKQIVYRSKDHSLVSELYEAGEITKQETRTLPSKNIIMKAIMPNQNERIMPDVVHIKDVQAGDLFYICTDGMLEQMGDDELLNILCNDELSDKQKIEWLESATENNRDNHSAYLIHVVDAVKESIDENEPDDELVARKNNKILDDDSDVNVSDSDVENNENQLVVVVEPSHESLKGQQITPPFVYAKNEKRVVNKDRIWMYIAVAAIAALAFLICYYSLGISKKETQQNGSLIMEQPSKDPNMKQYQPSNRTNKNVKEDKKYDVEDYDIGKEQIRSSSNKTVKVTAKENKDVDNKIREAAGEARSDKVKNDIKDVVGKEKGNTPDVEKIEGGNDGKSHRSEPTKDKEQYKSL